MISSFLSIPSSFPAQLAFSFPWPARPPPLPFLGRPTWAATVAARPSLSAAADEPGPRVSAVSLLPQPPRESKPQQPSAPGIMGMSPCSLASFKASRDPRAHPCCLPALFFAFARRRGSHSNRRSVRRDPPSASAWSAVSEPPSIPFFPAVSFAVLPSLSPCSLFLV